MSVNPNDYALVIGIKDYPNYKSLTNPVNDANAFADWLRDPHGGGLPANNCKVITSKSEDLSPVPTQIDDALDELIIQTRSGDPRRLYLFFSGHGLGIEPDNAGLCLTRWSERRMGMALSSGAYLDYLVNAGVFDEVFFFLDCCRIRAYHKQFHSPSLSDYGPGAGAKSVRRFVAYACEHTTSAYEPSLNDDKLALSSADNNGYFTQALLNGLRGDASQDGQPITAADLHDHLETHTSRLANAAGHNQKATCTSDFAPANSPVLAPGAARAAAVPVTITFSHSGNVKLENHAFETLQEGAVEPGMAWTENLEPGMYSLVSDAQDASNNFRVEPQMEGCHVEY